MTSSAYNACKALAYPLLATTCGCDHQKAKAQGYSDGWQMLLDKHDDNEMALFCTSLPQVMSLAQSTLLLDGLAQQYTEFATWGKFADACSSYPRWKPSREKLAQYIARASK